MASDITKEQKRAYRQMGREDGRAGRSASEFHNTPHELVQAYNSGHKSGKRTLENEKAQRDYELSKW